MSGGLEQIREGLTAHLNGKGIRAVPAWSGTARTFPGGPVAAVSLRGCRWGPAGFQDYLGERYDPEAGRWEELYGRRVKLTFGLDLYGERAQGDQALQAAFDSLAGALHREGPPGMRLLELSIWEDGYTMPCVCYYDAEKDLYELVDGYHRYLVLKRSKRIYERERGLLPVAVIEKDISNRMASTIRHNRARGTHNVELMSEIVAELTRANMSDQWIMRHIGMDRDELLRLKQITGLADLFADKEFSLGDTDEDSVEEMLEV